MRTSIGMALLIAGVLVAVSLTAFTTQARNGEGESGPTVWVADLSGGNEVPARGTSARGVAVFWSNADGSMDYILVVSRMTNVFAAHIHCGEAGVNAPVGVTLFMGTPASGPAQGLLVSSSFTGPDAVNGCGWSTNADVAAAVGAGAAYVNVHTNDGVDPPNTGPGDFPGGEIRGQVRILHD